MFFTHREIELAREMHQIGLWKEPAYGDWYIHTPPDTLVKMMDEKIIELYYSDDRNPRKRVYIWLPTWKQARQWLREKGYAEFEFLQDRSGYITTTAKGPDKISAKGTTDLEVIYELMLTLVKRDPSPAHGSAETAPAEAQAVENA